MTESTPAEGMPAGDGLQNVREASASETGSLTLQNVPEPSRSETDGWTLHNMPEAAQSETDVLTQHEEDPGLEGERSDEPDESMASELALERHQASPDTGPAEQAPSASRRETADAISSAAPRGRRLSSNIDAQNEVMNVDSEIRQLLLTCFTYCKCAKDYTWTLHTMSATFFFM